MIEHEPVLYGEVLDALSPRPNGAYIDGTVGGGGHAKGILDRCAPSGRLLGIDLDREAVRAAGERLAEYGDRVRVIHGSFADLEQLALQHGFLPADGVLLDLGVSSHQLANSERGFSFQADGPLDMRFDPSVGPPAEEIVNTLPEAELADVLFELGEERAARRIARAIVRARPLEHTSELASLVARVVPRRGRTHPATRTFQALRLYTNSGLETVSEGLDQAVGTLAPGARIVVISFHSLEDRIVKHFFRHQASRVEANVEPRLRVVTPHPVIPAEAERQRNPRSRSAKMRVAERTTAGFLS